MRQKSKFSGLVALGFLGCLFYLLLSIPDSYFVELYGGLLITSGLCRYYLIVCSPSVHFDF
jgi:hypothetical protein